MTTKTTTGELYADPPQGQKPRRGHQHRALRAVITYWAGDPSAFQRALIALHDIEVIIRVLAEAGVITGIATDVLHERIALVRAALQRYDSPWGPSP